MSSDDIYHVPTPHAMCCAPSTFAATHYAILCNPCLSVIWTQHNAFHWLCSDILNYHPFIICFIMCDRLSYHCSHGPFTCTLLAAIVITAMLNMIFEAYMSVVLSNVFWNNEWLSFYFNWCALTNMNIIYADSSYTLHRKKHVQWIDDVETLTQSWGFYSLINRKGHVWKSSFIWISYHNPNKNWSRDIGP